MRKHMKMSLCGGINCIVVMMLTLSIMFYIQNIYTCLEIHVKINIIVSPGFKAVSNIK